VLAVKGQTQLVGPQALEVLSTILQNEGEEAEAAYRALVALGNFVSPRTLESGSAADIALRRSLLRRQGASRRSRRLWLQARH